MIKAPFLVLAYGDFAKTHKLFAYDANGAMVIPIYTRGDVALVFMKEVVSKLFDQDDQRTLTIQVCESNEKACAMLRHIALSTADNIVVTIDNQSIDQESEFVPVEEVLSWFCRSSNLF